MGAERQGLVKPTAQAAKVASAGMTQQRWEGWGRSADTPSDEIVKPPKPQFRGVSEELRAARSDVVVMPKLVIGAPGDAYEQEADRVAQQVVQRLHEPDGERSQSEPTLQRAISPDENVQMKPTGLSGAAIAGGAASPDLVAAIDRARGSGQPLAAGLQHSMGQAMGADFSGVRVHTDGQADQLNRSIQAQAFTTGQDVFFRQGAYEPGSRGGQELIAHELAHVVQQNGWGGRPSDESKVPSAAVSTEGQKSTQDEERKKAGDEKCLEGKSLGTPTMNAIQRRIYKVASPIGGDSTSRAIMSGLEVELAVKGLQADTGQEVEEFYGTAARFNTSERQYMVGHGERSRLDGKNAAEIGGRMKDIGVDPGATIYLVACRLGEGGQDSFATVLEREIGLEGVKVYAAKEKVFYAPGKQAVGDEPSWVNDARNRISGAYKQAEETAKKKLMKVAQAYGSQLNTIARNQESNKDSIITEEVKNINAEIVKKWIIKWNGVGAETKKTLSNPPEVEKYGKYLIALSGALSKGPTLAEYAMVLKALNPNRPDLAAAVVAAENERKAAVQEVLRREGATDANAEAGSEDEAKAARLASHFQHYGREEGD